VQGHRAAVQGSAALCDWAEKNRKRQSRTLGTQELCAIGCGVPPSHPMLPPVPMCVGSSEQI